MARTVIVPVEMLKMNTAKDVAEGAALGELSSSTDTDIYTATTDTHGAAVPITKKGEKYLIIVANGAASGTATVHVRKGSHEAMAINDLTLSIPFGESQAIQLDTAKYMQLEGAHKNYIHITGAATTITVAAYELV